MIVFTNVSLRNNLIGAGICWFNILSITLLDKLFESVSLIIGTITEFNIYIRELIVI